MMHRFNTLTNIYMHRYIFNIESIFNVLDLVYILDLTQPYLESRFDLPTPESPINTTEERGKLKI